MPVDPVKETKLNMNIHYPELELCQKMIVMISLLHMGQHRNFDLFENLHFNMGRLKVK